MSKQKRITAKPGERVRRTAAKVVARHLARIDYVIAECQRMRALLEPVAAWASGKGELPHSVTRWGELAELVYEARVHEHNEAANKELSRTYHSHFKGIGDIEGALDTAVDEVFEAALGDRRKARDAA